MQFKYYVLLVWGILIPGLCLAQDIQPLGQARGYLEQKNASVDYATGIFQYSLPLAGLQAGDFSLPVSLNYTAKGVKVSDFSGSTGYNWNLLAGGIITRVVRGRNDELRGRPYDFKDGRTLTSAEMNEINNNFYDCEADLYQLVLAGQTVPFYLRGTSDLRAVPLVRTDVKISYHNVSPAPYWTVRDADGREYVFAAIEYLGVSREAEVSKNNYVASYPCSWYPTEIRIPAQDTIRLNYQDGKSLLSLQEDKFSGFPVVDSRLVTYHYGKKVNVYPFNFNKYQVDYGLYMQMAIDAWQEYMVKEQIKAMRENQEYVLEHVFYRIGRNIHYKAIWGENEAYAEQHSFDQEVLKYRQRVLGILGEWQDISEASNELIRALSAMINQMGASQAATYVSWAKDCVKQCLREVISTSENYQYTNTVYFYNPPYLKTVCCGEDSVCLEYIRSAGNFPVLQHVKSFHHDKLSAQVNLSYGSSHKLLKSVELLGAGSAVSEKWRFDYYHEDKEWSSQDCWGYFSSATFSQGNEVRPDCITRYSLAKITNSRKGVIALNYEPNAGPEEVVILNSWGGLRLKGIYTDNGAGLTDSIFYLYPEKGKLVFDTVSRHYAVNYGNFSDYIEYPRYQFEGNAILRTGNEGLYYPYVQEVMKGKGMTAYLYSVASPSGQSRCNSYSWWLTGQLLGTASYDENRRLVSVTQNHYAATLDYTGNFQGKAFYEQPHMDYAFRDSLWQVKAYPYFSNASYSTGSVLIYDDPGVDSYWIQPEADLRMREKVAVPGGFQQFYRLYIGGAALLKKSTEYRYFTRGTTTPARSDIEHPELLAGCCPVKQVEYHYDNPLRLQPTRIETLQSDGAWNCILNYTALDVAPGTNAMADSMRADNLVAPVLKQQVFVLPANSNAPVLQDETVALWSSRTTTGNRKWWLPGDIYHWRFQAGRSFPAFPASPVSSLFSYPQSEYRREQTVDYRLTEGKVDQISISAIAGSAVQLYDRPGGRILLTGIGADVQHVAAIQGRYLEQDVMDVLYLRYFFDVIVPGLPLNTFPALFREYLASTSYSKMRTFLMSFYNYCRIGGPVDFLWEQRMQLTDNDLGPFLSNFQNLASHPAFAGIYSHFEKFVKQIWFYSKADIGYYYQQCTGRLLPEYDGELSASPLAASQLEVARPIAGTYRLWLYVKPECTTPQISLQLKLGNGAPQTIQLPIQPGKGQVIGSDIVVPPGMSGSLRVSIPRPACVGCAVLAPAGMAYQVSGTDAYGREEISFDESGTGKRQVYDDASRLWQVYDAKGNLLQQMNYHLVNP